MKPVNLKCLIDAKRELAPDMCTRLFESWSISPKDSECTAIESLIKQLESLAPDQPELVYRLLGECYLGFSIPRISKEFDCLWIGEKTVINVELKSKTIEEEKIKKQLTKNRWYLRSIGKAIFSYTYVASTGCCYTLDSCDNIVTTDIKTIAISLFNVHKELLFEGNIEDKFPPEDFLVSPFNSTEDFINKKYFLTNQQQDIKTKVLRFIDDNTAGCFCAISGGPGSGKTLLLYDIARTLMESGKKVYIGHAGILNSGHSRLIEEGWLINSTKEMLRFNQAIAGWELIEGADVFFIDEAQRTPHLNYFSRDVPKMGKKCIFSFDTDQIMSNKEQSRGNDQMIQCLVGNQCFRLTSNIRTNMAVYEFVRALFDKSKSVNRDIHDNVKITYCNSETKATLILKLLKEKGYIVPKYTPGVHSTEDYEVWFPFEASSAHQVIGQEFDCVAGILSSNMVYDTNGNLVSNKNYRYREDKMLYQILSRARKNIHLVIANNPVVLDRCMKLIIKN